ncbi:MAG TPA: ParB/Srx family N-terminal domain-containing protein [Xanthobacteraceae bacterium]|nr:ParB/Srx family N-terminal domain-containing protein [Xanthobacteraceae bacterium]
MAEFGFTNPILIGADDVIIAGHGRLLAAKRLGLAEVPVIVLNHLSEAQRRALVIADNKIAANAGWDEAMLRAELAALREEEFDLGVLGFDEAELVRILDSIDGTSSLGGEDAGGTGNPPDGSPASEPHRAGGALRHSAVLRARRAQGLVAGAQARVDRSRHSLRARPRRRARRQPAAARSGAHGEDGISRRLAVAGRRLLEIQGARRRAWPGNSEPLRLF